MNTFPPVAHERADIGMVAVIRRCQHFAVIFAEAREGLRIGKCLQQAEGEDFAGTCVGSGGAGDAIFTNAVAEGLRGVMVMRVDAGDDICKLEGSRVGVQMRQKFWDGEWHTVSAFGD